MRALWILAMAFASSCAPPATPAVVTLEAVPPPVVSVHTCGPADPATCHDVAEEVLPTNPQIAYQYEHYACGTGVVASCGALGHLMLRGIWGESDPEQALFYLDGACSKGVAASCVDLGVLDRDVRHDDARAIARFSADCEARHVGLACDELGRMVEDGRGFAPDRDAARRLFDHACVLGEAAGCGDLGRVLLDADRVRAMHLLERACTRHDGRACYELGRMAKSSAVALSDFKRACNLGVASGCASVAWAIDPYDRSMEAEFWMNRACDERDARACEHLADVLGAPSLRARAERIEAK